MQKKKKVGPNSLKTKHGLLRKENFPFCWLGVRATVGREPIFGLLVLHLFKVLLD